MRVPGFRPDRNMESNLRCAHNLAETANRELIFPQSCRAENVFGRLLSRFAWFSHVWMNEQEDRINDVRRDVACRLLV